MRMKDINEGGFYALRGEPGKRKRVKVISTKQHPLSSLKAWVVGVTEDSPLERDILCQQIECPWAEEAAEREKLDNGGGGLLIHPDFIRGYDLEMIMPAFEGIEVTPADLPGLTETMDLKPALRYLFPHHNSRTVFTQSFLEKISARIFELSELAKQSMMIAGDIDTDVELREAEREALSDQG